MKRAKPADPTSKYCLCIESLQFIPLELHCCPETINNTSKRHAAAQGDMFIHYDKRRRCSLFWADPHVHHPAAVNSQSSTKRALILSWK